MDPIGFNGLLFDHEPEPPYQDHMVVEPEECVPFEQQWNASNSNEGPSVYPSECDDILDEIGPLGLRMRNSDSFSDMLQYNLDHSSQASMVTAENANIENFNSGAQPSQASIVTAANANIENFNFGVQPSQASMVTAANANIENFNFGVQPSMVTAANANIENFNSGMQPSQASMVTTANANNENCNSRVKRPCQRATDAASSSGSVKAPKATSLPATLLRIGSWESNSKQADGLVAKFYFAKQQLIWEILEGSLKKKIEIQWSNIVALKADCPDNGPSLLTVVLATQPRFFKECALQPKKHTQWEVAPDFTNGQALQHRTHFLLCEQGKLTKNFEKLIQCDARLKDLSRQPVINLDSFYSSENQSSASENIDNLIDNDLHRVNGETEQNGPPVIGFDSEMLLHDNVDTEASSDEDSLMGTLNFLLSDMEMDPPAAAAAQNAAHGGMAGANVHHDEAPGMARTDSFEDTLENLPKITPLPCLSE